ncbi:MAG: hypothetical protein BGO98_08785 [Myxococcales bacterium 68-20]|nr:MAG: hypothetical protein BGO98_08785 [Myxococcales bacterium 68-20]
MKDVAIPRTTLAAAASFLVLTSATTLALTACSDSVEIAIDDSTPDSGGGGSVIPVTDASPEIDAGESPDAPDDASVDPDAGDAGTRICSDDNFCHTEVPKGQNLAGVWGDGTGIVWAVSRKGDLLRWDGSAWSVHTQLTNVTGTTFTIWGSGPTDIWVLTPGGLFHGTGPSSATLVFAPVVLPGDATIPIKSIGGTGPNDVWAVGGVTNSSKYPWDWRGRILHYDGDPAEGGSGWIVDESFASQPMAFSVVVASPVSGVWLAAQEYRNGTSPSLAARLYRRASGVEGWTDVGLPLDLEDKQVGWNVPGDLTAIAMSSASAVWVRGATANYKAGFWRGASTNGGNDFSWSFKRTNSWDRPIVALWGTAPNDTWGVGPSGLVTHWNGTKWQQAAIRVTDIPVAKSFNAIWGKSTDDFWVVGDEVALHRTPAGKP